MSLDIGMITRHRVVFGGRVCACVLNVQSSSSFMWAQKEVGQLYIHRRRCFPMGLHLFWDRSAQLFWVFGLKRMASWGVGICVFKGGGGSVDLLVTR